MHTVRCWQCGAVIPVEDARRVTVTTGTTGGRFGNPFDLRSSGWVSGSTYERVDFCPPCFEARRQNGAVNGVIATVLIIAVSIGGVVAVLAFIHHHSPQGGSGPAAEGQPNATKNFQAQQNLARERRKLAAEKRKAEVEAQQKLAEEKRKAKALLEKVRAEVAEAEEQEAARLLGLAKAQLADGEARLQKATTATAGEKLIKFGMKRLEDIIDRYPQTQAAADARQLLGLLKK
jgi:hypothetical protein